MCEQAVSKGVQGAQNDKAQGVWKMIQRYDTYRRLGVGELAYIYYGPGSRRHGG
jgi:hypothetical protein